MKSPDQVIESLRIKVFANWHLDVTAQAVSNAVPGRAVTAEPTRPMWPRSLPIGSATQADLELNFGTYQQQVFAWRDWAAEHGLELVEVLRRVNGTIQKIPTHLRIDSLDTAAVLLGGDWPARLERGRRRVALLRSRFPGVPDLATIVRETDSFTDTDFELLCSAARWFARNADTAAGLSPREVPVEGLHAKWLNTRRPLVAALAGVASLELATTHPARIHFRYLDPDYLATGARQHDSVTVGDTMFPPYLPEIVVITENKDSALHFPPLPGAIVVEGAGFTGATAIPGIDWIAEATDVIYWGDMDTAGFEIVNQFRSAGMAMDTILMDLRTFENYERFGARTDDKGRELTHVPAKDLPMLTRRESELYDLLTDPEWSRVRRVEQERIPIAVAVAAVRSLAGLPAAD
ncbi:MAG: hypothetical protein JWQ43_3340 [Glaciihabitans sp.]|nr:hypothetical protein [Glaciihabitans sp.]